MSMTGTRKKHTCRGARGGIKMNENQIPIWDDIYPCEFFEGDIMNNRLI